MYDAVVVGAGFAGIHAARLLEQHVPDARILVLEASDHVGGRARSVPGPTRHGLDLGAHYFGPEHVRVDALARRLLGDDAIFDRLGVYASDPAFRCKLDHTWRVTTRDTSFFQIQGLSRKAPLLDRIKIFESICWYLMHERLVDSAHPWRSRFAARLDAITVQQWIDGQRVPAWIDDMWGLAAMGVMSCRAEQMSLMC